MLKEYFNLYITNMPHHDSGIVCIMSFFTTHGAFDFSMSLYRIDISISSNSDSFYKTLPRKIDRWRVPLA